MNCDYKILKLSSFWGERFTVKYSSHDWFLFLWRNLKIKRFKVAISCQSPIWKLIAQKSKFRIWKEKNVYFKVKHFFLESLEEESNDLFSGSNLKNLRSKVEIWTSNNKFAVQNFTSLYWSQKSAFYFDERIWKMGKVLFGKFLFRS